MKKLLLTLAGGLFMASSFAQQIQDDYGTQHSPILTSLKEASIYNPGVAQKSTGLTDTLYFADTAQLNGHYYNAYYDLNNPIDSGRFFGTNFLGYKGFGALYSYNRIDIATPADTTYNILGLYALFVGTVNSSSTKTATLTIWKRDAAKYAVTGRAKFYIYGEPTATPVATKSFTFPSLTMNSLKKYYFSTPITGVNYDIYAGYTLSSYSFPASTGGDTIGLATCLPPFDGTYSIETGTLDTLVNAATVIQTASGAWKSSAFELGKRGELVCFPIVKLSCAKCGVGVANFKRNDLTFYGNYPNPATSTVNVKFELKSAADVTIYVSDLVGHTISTVKASDLNIGEHVMQLNTSNLASGNYTYLILTSKGDGIASEFTIIK